MKRFFGIVLFVVFIASLAPLTSWAQDISAVTGVVTDASGAVIVGAEVTLVNTTTNASYHGKTNSVGSYTFVNIPPGPGYKMTFMLSGFEPFAVTDIALNVATTRTQNAKLRAGNVATSVEVSAASDEVTIDTTDATVGNIFDAKLLNALPVQDRGNPTTLFTLQPGVTSDGAVTGARVDQDNVTLDGLDVNDFATGVFPAVIAFAPVDSVQEFRGTVAGFGVGSGPGGGGQFQLVTQSGNNAFHGDLNEYHRDTSTEANGWFANDAIPKLARTPLIRNQFGGKLAGPILRDKLFFMFDFNQSRIIQSSQVSRTVPLNSFRNGTVSYILNKDVSGNTCGSASRQNTTPQCIGSLSAAQAKALDPAGIGYDTSLLTFVNSRYPAPNDLTGGDGINTGLFRFNAPTPDISTNYVARADYTLSSKMKVFGRFSIVRRNSVESTIEFPGDPATAPYVDRSYAYVIGHTWEISPTKVNVFFYGDTVAKLSFPNTYNPQGSNILTSGLEGGNTFLSDPYRSPINAQGRRIPIPEVGDNFSWQKGTHLIEFGGNFKFIKTHSFTKLDYNLATVGVGGNMPGLTGSLRPSDIRTAGSTSALVYDNAYSYALGRIGSINSDFNYDSAGNALPLGTGDNRQYRYFQTQLFVGDTWKVNPSLTLSYGLNWEIFSVPYETHGLESVQPLTFNQYFSARVTQSANGTTGNSAVPLIAYVLGGKANNGPSLYQPSYKDIAPKFAFAYNPSFNRKVVINGGVGLVYDRTIVNAVQYQQDQHSYLFQQSTAKTYGTPSNPVTSLKNDPRVGANNSIPAISAPPAIKAPYMPFVDTDCASSPAPCGLQNGQAFNTIIDPDLKTPYSIQYNAGLQHDMPGHLVFKVSYVGRLGRRLLGQADANQIVDFTDPASKQLLSTAFANMTTQLRAGANSKNLPAQAWMENQVIPGFGASQTYKDSAGVVHHYPNNTSWLADTNGGIPVNGDFADFVQAISSFIAPNVGMAAQFSENTFYTNKGFSSYNGLLTTLQKNLSHGLQFDFNYTFAHSMDNVSLIANQGAAGGYGFICDVVRPRECRGNSDFDVTHVITADFTYNLPFGRGRTFGGTMPFWLNEAVGGWDVSGITQWHSGTALSTVSNAFVAGYSNDAPAILVGNKANVVTHVTRSSTGAVNLFADSAAAQASYVGPTGFQIGSRNTLRGPRFFNQNLGLAKNFPILTDKLNLKFRADAFNAFNHPSFGLPGGPLQSLDQTDTAGGTFGQITSTASTARVLQLALRLEF